MSVDPSSTFAVLIGIDDYLGEASNLHGCVNDVRIVLESLDSLGVQRGNLSVLTSPPNVLGDMKTPTKGNVLDLIREVATRAAENPWRASSSFIILVMETGYTPSTPESRRVRG